MNLAIDVGNTFTKVGVFNSGNLIHTHRCNTSELVDNLRELKEEFPITKAVVAFVGHLSQNQLSELNKMVELLILDRTVPVPFVNNYHTPNTLGVDRIALVAAAVKYFPDKDVLIIDAGTCITYDFLSKGKEYEGGSISPGLKMRYRAMNHFTAALPLLEPESVADFLGKTTETAMHTGIIYGIINEIEGFITLYQNNHADLTVILTGGDAHFLRDRLKNDIFANPNFLLEGLNYILEFNQI